MAFPSPDIDPDDWRRIRDALRYMGRDLYHRSFSVTCERRDLLWEEMDRCLGLADRLDQALSPLEDPMGPDPSRPEPSSGGS
jgi:hypothetical protein